MIYKKIIALLLIGNCLLAQQKELKLNYSLFVKATPLSTKPLYVSSLKFNYQQFWKTNHGFDVGVDYLIYDVSQKNFHIKQKVQPFLQPKEWIKDISRSVEISVGYRYRKYSSHRISIDLAAGVGAQYIIAHRSKYLNLITSEEETFTNSIPASHGATVVLNLEPSINMIPFERYNKLVLNVGVPIKLYHRINSNEGLDGFNGLSFSVLYIL